MSPPAPARSLGEVLRLFLRLGLTAFGGPAAHLSLMERETVDRRGWLTRERFLDLVGACNLLPGPSSTQVAMALGYTRAGWPGLLLAGACFIFPAALATLALAFVYVRFGSLPEVQSILAGAKPVMVAIVGQAVWRLGRTAWRTVPLAAAGLASLAAALFGAPALAILLVCGCLFLIPLWRKSSPAPAPAFLALPVASAALPALSLGSIAVVFLKLGVVVFGSGYVLLAFLQTDLVDRLHWVTSAQLLDAVTAGQLTPGPVFATATFLGYLLGGVSGAAVATAAIFLPSFLLASLVAAAAPRLRSDPRSAAFLNRAAIAGPLGAVIAVFSLLVLLFTRLNPTWLLLGGSLLSLLVRG